MIRGPGLAFEAGDDSFVLRNVRGLLGAAQFQNVDVGPLNDALAVDNFVVSIPKCGTSAIQRGLDRIGRPVIHVHTDMSTFAAFPNGNLLRNNDLGMANIIRARIAAKPERLNIFFGYRDPVSWYLSVAGHFGLALDDHLRDSTIRNMEFHYPWCNYRIDEIAAIVRGALGINVLDFPFDAEAGLSRIVTPAADVVLYRFDRLDAVRDHIVRHIDERFALRGERVNEDPAYVAYRDAFKLPLPDLLHIDQDRWFRHFYTPSERIGLMCRHLRS